MSNNKKLYELTTTSDEFKERTKSTFDSLKSLENVHKTKRKLYEHDSSDDNNIQDHANNNNQKAPLLIQQPKRPDYVLNPNKWKKYSLEDVDESKMSTRANYQAAMDVLNMNKTSYMQINPDININDEQKAPIFNRNLIKIKQTSVVTVKQQSKSIETENLPSFSNENDDNNSNDSDDSVQEIKNFNQFQKPTHKNIRQRVYDDDDDDDDDDTLDDSDESSNINNNQNKIEKPENAVIIDDNNNNNDDDDDDIYLDDDDEDLHSDNDEDDELHPIDHRNSNLKPDNTKNFKEFHDDNNDDDDENENDDDFLYGID